MSDLLREYELKRGHANRHLNDLRKEVERISAATPEPVRGEFDAVQSRYTFRPPVDPLDPTLALLVGDVAHCLRAAVNYLVTALVRSTGQEEDRWTEFPIYGIDLEPGKPRYWREIDNLWETDSRGRIAAMLARTPSGTKDALKPLQPFFGVPRTDPVRHPLFQLQQLSNTDKHRRLNLLVRGAEIVFVDSSGAPIYPGRPHRARVVETEVGGRYVVALNVTTDEQPREIFLAARYDVLLIEPPELSGNLLATLNRICNYIDTRVKPAVRELL